MLNKVALLGILNHRELNYKTKSNGTPIAICECEIYQKSNLGENIVKVTFFNEKAEQVAELDIQNSPVYFEGSLKGADKNGKSSIDVYGHQLVPMFADNIAFNKVWVTGEVIEAKMIETKEKVIEEIKIKNKEQTIKVFFLDHQESKITKGQIIFIEGVLRGIKNNAKFNMQIYGKNLIFLKEANNGNYNK